MNSAENHRVLCTIGGELLTAAVEEDAKNLDGALFPHVFGRARAA